MPEPTILKGILKTKKDDTYVKVHPETEVSQIVDFQTGISDNIDTAVDNISPVTQDTDGLMSKEDKEIKWYCCQCNA